MANSTYRAAMRRRLIAKAFDRLLADVETVNREVEELRTCTDMAAPVSRRQYEQEHREAVRRACRFIEAADRRAAYDRGEVVA